MFNPFSWAFGMGAPEPPGVLEIRRRSPSGAAFRTPLVFVHGAFVGAWCWDEHFLGYLSGRGFHTVAPSLRGHGGSAGDLQRSGVADYVADLESVVAELDTPPVLIGHSMGGLVVQKYLERHACRAAVLMASVPPTGLVQSTLRLLLGDPMLFTQLTFMQGLGPGAVNAEIARRAVFSDHLSAADLARFSRYMQPESQRALWDMTAGALPRPWQMDVPPMLVMAAAGDTLFSVREAEGAARRYNAELHVEPEMAHAMMLEPGWRNVADRLVDWLAAQGVE